ncbi:MAG: hypothetical protein LBH04_11460 [Tannerellaceae bacterium]|nr:hypothetical protein [Tannerellaceae bacterium]
MFKDRDGDIWIGGKSK